MPMNISRLVVFRLLVVMILFSACATEKQSLRLTDTLNLYSSSIRWSDFRGAVQFYDKPSLYQHIKFDRLKAIKVTGYDVEQSQLSQDGNELKQTVVIRYYHTDVGSEHQLVDHQVWKYYPGKEVWLLNSVMPVFK